MTTIKAVQTERCINCGGVIVTPTPNRPEGSRLYFHTTNDMSIACWQVRGEDGSYSMLDEKGNPTVAQPATAAELFFFDFAGYSHDPRIETEVQGRMRCARSLAEAERAGKLRGWEVVWSDDWTVDHQQEFDCYEENEPQSCEMALLVDDKGNALASFGCIDDANENYRRVIEAQLADEALGVVNEDGKVECE